MVARVPVDFINDGSTHRIIATATAKIGSNPTNAVLTVLVAVCAIPVVTALVPCWIAAAVVATAFATDTVIDDAGACTAPTSTMPSLDVARIAAMIKFDTSLTTSEPSPSYVNCTLYKDVVNGEVTPSEVKKSGAAATMSAATVSADGLLNQFVQLN